MSDASSMSCPVSHSTRQNATHVLEQRNLLGGTDLVPILGGGKRKRARQFHVASERRLGFAAALALVVEHGRQKARETGVTSMTRCPRCDHVGPTATDFGYRVIRGERRPQSWCRGCRGQHLAPANPNEPLKMSTSQAPKPAAPEEGWLFPPETLRARPRKKGGKR
ncbi:hypothetical protein [Hyalangium rubrum]|uniref:Uncharacterized protein n=1 Tax=Hyalangium rubrum TaxID=3103134 RepID=A0ABU5HAK7_9BACT|nr:hypothetical protein [Hyalangium sp. s54d21]MDY7230124.1 hypothetical protein [Hyalangium sp. s54d21]